MIWTGQSSREFQLWRSIVGKTSLWFWFAEHSSQRDSQQWKVVYCHFPVPDTFDILGPRQNGHFSTENIFKLIFLYENCCTLIKFWATWLQLFLHWKGCVEMMKWRNCSGYVFFPLTRLGREKWPPFCRQHFDLHFCSMKLLQRVQYASSCLDNDLRPSRRPQLTDAYMRHLASIS